MNDVIFFFGLHFPSAIGLILITLAIHAPVLKWRANSKTFQHLSYKKCLLIASKANSISFLVSITILGIIYFNSSVPNDTDSLAGLFGILAWWIVHSNAVFAEFNDDTSFKLKDARYFSLGIFGWNFTIIMVPILAVVLLSGLI